jgi:hypothetical protein
MHEEAIHARQVVLGGPDFEKHYTFVWGSLPKPVHDLLQAAYTGFPEVHTALSLRTFWVPSLRGW